MEKEEKRHCIHCEHVIYLKDVKKEKCYIERVGEVEIVQCPTPGCSGSIGDFFKCDQRMSIGYHPLYE